MLGGVRSPWQTVAELAADIAAWAQLNTGMFAIYEGRRFQGMTGIQDRPQMAAAWRCVSPSGQKPAAAAWRARPRRPPCFTLMIAQALPALLPSRGQRTSARAWCLDQSAWSNATRSCATAMSCWFMKAWQRREQCSQGQNLFFEKRKKKTFAIRATRSDQRPARHQHPKVFLLLFLQKMKNLPSYRRSPATARRARRHPTKHSPANPKPSMPQVPGSGTS